MTDSLCASGFDASEDETGRGTPLVPVGFQETGQGYWMQHDVACGLRDMSAGSGAAIANVITQSVAGGEDKNALRTSIAQTITADMYRSGGATAGNNPGTRNCFSHGMAVRRLLPIECERLQGFPDDYTLIPELSKRKSTKRYDARLNDFLKDAADGPRYKALGNSMAVPVMAWIGRRIQSHAKP